MWYNCRMALNLTPEYFEADRQYRQARTPAEKLAALELMLRAIPKHKSSEKKQSDLKRQISELRHARQVRKKGGAPDPYHIVSQGAGQALLFGLPNCGKSSIVGCLTKATVKVTDFPYGTPLPVPGMAYHEDVPIELVDLPPVTPDHMPPGMINAIRNTDVILPVVDLGAGSVLEDLEALLGILAERGITFDSPSRGEDEEHMHVGPQGLILCTKADLPEAGANFEALKELRPSKPAMLAVSAHTGQGLEEMTRTLFEMLDVIRIYAKPPGKPADMSKPFVLPRGSTVQELATVIHKEMACGLKYARIWGEHVFDGQRVHGHQVLHDRDSVELHT